VLAKSCKLPNAITDYSNLSGMVPTDSLRDYCELGLLDTHEADGAGLLNLQTISSNTVSLAIGRLCSSELDTRQANGRSWSSPSALSAPHS
jgi:hypothetical protein